MLFLADDESSYAKALEDIIEYSAAQRDAIRIAARESVSRFTDDVFDNKFVDVISPILMQNHRKHS